MSNKLVKEKNKKNNTQNNIILPIIAGIVVVAAIVVFVGTHFLKSGEQTASVTNLTESQTTGVNEEDGEKNDSDAIQASDSQAVEAEIEDGNLIIDASVLSETVTFVPYNSNGTDMEIMVVKTSDGVIRCALNTCQVCNGSPYAYFEQSGDTVICQNCMNQFQLTQIGNEQGGCNPIPVTFKEQDGHVLIATSDLDADASKFTGWKQGI